MNKQTREIFGCDLPNIPFSQSCGEGVISNDIVIDISVKKCEKVADQMKLMKSQLMQHIDASNSSLDSFFKNLRNLVTTASLGLGVVDDVKNHAVVAAKEAVAVVCTEDKGYHKELMGDAEEVADPLCVTQSLPVQSYKRIQVANLIKDGGCWSKEEEKLVWSLTGMGVHFEGMKPAADLVVKQWEIYDRGRFTSGQENGKQS